MPRLGGVLRQAKEVMVSAEGSSSLAAEEPPAPPTERADVRTTVAFEPGNVWRTGLVVIALLGVALFLGFVLDDAGSVIFTLLIA
jgi:hypothetical protein